MRRNGPGKDEDAGADDRADAEEGEVPWAEDAFEAGVGEGFLLKFGDALSPE